MDELFCVRVILWVGLLRERVLVGEDSRLEMRRRLLFDEKWVELVLRGERL